MKNALDSLLSENEHLKNQLALLAHQLSEQQALLHQNQIIIRNKATLIEHLQQQIKLHQLARFGRKGEKLDGQMGLFDEATLTPEQEANSRQVDEALSRPSIKRKPGGRRPLLAEFPREQIIHDLAEHEKQCVCGHTLHKMREDVSEQLEIIPAHVKVLQHVRYQYGCRHCEMGVRSASLPAQPIPKSIASAGLLAHVLVSKFSDHLPLYRQEHILQRYGIDLNRGTLCHWVLACGELVQPLIDLMQQTLLARDYLCVDETPVQVLMEKGQAKQSKGYMWVYASGRPEDRLVLYDYQPNRAGEHVTLFLANYQGYLQTDGYTGYSALQAKETIRPLGCWAHCRRKFMDIVKTTKTQGKAFEAVRIIKALYQVEKEARENRLSPQAIMALRDEKSKPVLIQFRQWLEETLPTTPPSGLLAKAIQYALNQWEYLQTYLTHGTLMIDNNMIENLIRPFALGRRNWLFMGNERGAKAAANIYSLIMMAKAHTIDAYQYVKYLLTTLPTCKTDEERKQLLPPYSKESFKHA